MTKPVLEIRDISKTFPGVKALDQVRLDLYPGEVTALIGENGAGKSTLVKTLTGIYQPDGGEIRLDGRVIIIHSPDEARHAGITAIHQETVMFNELSVAENIFIGHHQAPSAPWAAPSCSSPRRIASLRLAPCSISPADAPYIDLSPRGVKP